MLTLELSYNLFTTNHYTLYNLFPRKLTCDPLISASSVVIYFLYFLSIILVCRFSQKSPWAKFRLKVEFKKFAVTLGEATSYIYLSNSEIKLEY